MTADVEAAQTKVTAALAQVREARAMVEHRDDGWNRDTLDYAEKRYDRAQDALIDALAARNVLTAPRT